MSDKIENISYIISYRDSNPERRKSLLFLLSYLRKHFPPLQIIVVEQDSTSKIQFEDSLNIQHIFVYNPSFFNCSWALNVGARKSDKDIIVFGDADIFLEKADYLACFEALDTFEAVTPNKTEALNVEIADKTSHEVRFLNKRPLFNFAGGMLIMTRQAYQKAGGWDERFEGWGGEDDAFSHVILNRLTTRTFSMPFYHIAHPASDWQDQAQLALNKRLISEIQTFHGPALDRYIDRLTNGGLGNPKKYSLPLTVPESPKFILAITTFNRIDYLKDCVESFLRTRNPSATWQLIIADDGSTDGTQTYLDQLQKEHHAIIIRNHRTHIHRQLNTVLRALSSLDFDLCFRCDDDVLFSQPGWDDNYFAVIQRTGYDHLIFYDKKWRSQHNLDRPIQRGDLISNCPPSQIQGAFYTLTPRVIQAVGYFDTQQFGRSGLGHIDYSFRCCRAGFNSLATPFDLANSNDFLQLHGDEGYRGALSSRQKSASHSKAEIEFKKQLFKTNRIYIPYNETDGPEMNLTQTENTVLLDLQPSSPALPKYQKADATYYPERGIMGIFGYILKNLYNWSIDWKIYFIPRGVKSLGKTLNKIGIGLRDIDS